MLEIKINNLILRVPTSGIRFRVDNCYLSNNSTYYDLFWSTVMLYLYSQRISTGWEIKEKELNLKSVYSWENYIWRISCEK